MISIANLSVVFNPGDILQARALRDVSLEIRAGEFISVIGSNGAGKSTLLSAIAGDILPTAGIVKIAGADVSALPAHARAGAIARVFQDPLAGSCPWLTIEENMALALSRGRKRGLAMAVSPDKRRHFQDRLKTLNLNLENRLGDYVGKLSGGQRQALSLMMATLADSKILLLDEHAAALDPRMAQFVMGLTERLCRDYRLTALMVTHSMQSALAMGSRAIMLHQGKIVLDIAGERRANLRPPDLLRLFSAACGDGADNDRLALSAA